ncbi:hypothetical protein IQ06DRAFT_342611 [Phaeosphaeriaceae sp. SRC1lsM3a]|nr:hypothetical protein IQ06DRAFT_342611 [Stagonospora sp. SRC1lsM3a]
MSIHIFSFRDPLSDIDPPNSPSPSPPPSPGPNSPSSWGEDSENDHKPDSHSPCLRQVQILLQLGA